MTSGATADVTRRRSLGRNRSVEMSAPLGDEFRRSAAHVLCRRQACCFAGAPLSRGGRDHLNGTRIVSCCKTLNRRQKAPKRFAIGNDDLSAEASYAVS